MRTTKVLTLTLEEARQIALEFYADLIVSDRLNVLEHLQSGTLPKIVPDVTQWNALDLADMFAELNMGEAWGVRAGVDQVYVDLGDGMHETLSCVWDIENVDEPRRSNLANEYKSAKVSHLDPMPV